MLPVLPLVIWLSIVRYIFHNVHIPPPDGIDECIYILYMYCIAENKLLIVKLGGLDQLVRQMGSPNVEVQCNAVGCITNLATHGKYNNEQLLKSYLLQVYIDENKSRIANSEALRLLIDLARSKDQRVQRNATGALLNMTHTREWNFLYFEKC